VITNKEAARSPGERQLRFLAASPLSGALTLKLFKKLLKPLIYSGWIEILDMRRRRQCGIFEEDWVRYVV